ncbi:MAG: hypothetical protein IT198_07050 [Acidimicrobiia bacterium]|nr:hypothetical protein [Acidimicrobiia bacterium]
MSRLEDVIGAPVDVTGLDPGDADRLADLVVSAKRRQAEVLGSAIDGALGNIPRLLRGPVKALLK